MATTAVKKMQHALVVVDTTEQYSLMAMGLTGLCEWQ